jgi:predicted restriction endonuclease
MEQNKLSNSNNKNIKLEDYLDKINQTDNKINFKILDSWEYFNYSNKEIFINDIELLIQLIYSNIKICQDSNIRLSQTEFRKSLIEFYDGKCVITQNDSLEELEASHIVEHKDLGDSDLSNGLLLEANLHKTFDKYLWTINPDSLEIESSPKNITKSIKNHIGKKIDLQMNPILYTNLKKRYEIFLEKI